MPRRKSVADAFAVGVEHVHRAIERDRHSISASEGRLAGRSNDQQVGLTIAARHLDVHGRFGPELDGPDPSFSV